MKKRLICTLALVLAAMLMLTAFAAGCTTENNDSGNQQQEAAPTQTADQQTEDNDDKASEQPATTKKPEAEPTEIPKKDVYCVGDTVVAGGLRLLYLASGIYRSDNMFLQPDEGNQYIFLRFFVENTGSRDDTVSYFDFNCYADGYSCDAFYGADDSLSATLSPGRTTTGSVCFEVPKDAEEIEIEYEINAFTSEKIKFVYEGEKDSGIVPDTSASATEDAYKPGDVVETSTLRITYISAEETTSDNMFIQPKEGYHYVTFSFEFENISSSDAYVSSFSFDCYADGAACDSTYFRDDDLGSATLSPGRKVKGTVTFEVPDNASVVEVEYDEISVFGSRIVFSYV